ncbi:hypothetical protein GR183_00750 [Stappia sp. GBMRC 2046]|uniref:Uncharacterized protein n=1 Tax=Stappia sediminis TaxID=2692190 RepID=A0A7X3S5R0_9HYPH|nr:hypothetical protein [Stappia sediminis]MXN63419.1 hypothetical protein [Stappia sediminis]
MNDRADVSENVGKAGKKRAGPRGPGSLDHTVYDGAITFQRGTAGCIKTSLGGGSDEANQQQRLYAVHKLDKQEAVVHL